MSHRVHRLTIFAGFCLLGITASMTGVFNSQLKLHFNLSDGHFGSILTVASLVSLPVQFFGGPLLHRFGKRLFVAVTLMRTVFPVAIALATHSWELYFLLAPLSAATGLYNAVINAGALHHEHFTQQPTMTNAHAMFSLGAIVGSAFAGLVLWLGAGVTAAYLTLAVVSVLSLGLVDVATGLAHDPEAGARPPFDWAILKNKAFVAIILLTVLGGMGEATLYVWTPIYLRQSLHSAALVGALGSTGFYAAMTVGRFAATPVQKRLQRLSLLTAAGIVIALGMTIALSTTNVVVTIGGIVIAGIAYSVLVPIGMSVAATAAGNNPAAVAGIGNAAMVSFYLLAPTIVGTLATLSNLRSALTFVIATGATVAVGATLFRRQHPAYN